MKNSQEFLTGESTVVLFFLEEWENTTISLEALLDVLKIRYFI